MFLGDVFGPLEFSRRDLGAINIQRARDHGLPDYQTVRETFGLLRLRSYEDMHNGSIDTNLKVSKFNSLYNDQVSTNINKDVKSILLL